MRNFCIKHLSWFLLLALVVAWFEKDGRSQSPLSPSGNSLTDTGGRLINTPQGNGVAQVDANPNTLQVALCQSAQCWTQAVAYAFNGTTWDRYRTAALANFPTSVTLTARNSIGGTVTEKGSRWSVFSGPAGGSQATASIAAEAAVRHVVDCISFSAASTAAVAASNLNINVRDGATGAGTVIWQYIVATPTAGAAGVQEVSPQNFCGLNLVGTTNTAMTLEFNSSLTGLGESVSISGYNVN